MVLLRSQNQTNSLFFEQAEMEARSDNRWMCNELVRELCLNIPIVKTSDSILLTAYNIYSYLAPRFSKKLVYRDAIAFLKAKLNANKHVQIRIDGMAHNYESEPIVSENMFKLETNKFRIHIWRTNCPNSEISILDNHCQLEWAQLLYFLRLIAPLVMPIHLICCFSQKPIEHLMRFLNALSGCIDKIGLSPGQFNSTKFYEALGNNLEIYCSLYFYVRANMPKLVHWLTTPTNNNSSGRTKKCLSLWGLEMTKATLFLYEIKKDFARATSKCRFVVRLKLEDEQLDEFTVCNELTGERLELRRKDIKYGRTIYELSRCPNNEFDNNNEDNWTEFAHQMTAIYFT